MDDKKYTVSTFATLHFLHASPGLTFVKRKHREGYARPGAAVPILPTAGGAGAALRATTSWL